MHLVYETGDWLVSSALEKGREVRLTVKKRQYGECSLIIRRRHLLDLHALCNNVMMGDHDLTS